MCWWKPADKLIKSAILTLSLSLGACAQFKSQPSVELPLLPAQSWDAKFQMNQSASIAPQKTALLLALVKLEDSLEINVLSNLGQRLLQLKYDKNGIHSTKHWPDITLPAETILKQLQAALWPTEILEAHYPEEWGIEDSDCMRHITYRQQRLLSVDYCAQNKGDNDRLGGARIEDLQNGIVIDIKTHELVPL